MSDLERITGLISEIYDAALDASLWPQVLRRIKGLLQGVALPTDLFYSAVDAGPALAESCAAGIGTVEDEEPWRSILRVLTPHFRRAVTIARTLERSESKSGALGEVLERLSSAVIFVDRDGRLVHANGPAAQMLAAREVLSWSGGKPRPLNERAAAHLEATLAIAHRAHPAAECCALSVAHCTQSGERMMVHVLPLSAGTRRHVTAQAAAAAAIVVSQQSWDLPQRLQSAARLYGLTPAESRVVGVLLTGCTIGGAARTLGIKEATVKTHLQHVFDKTGTRRQVDLAQRIADCGCSVSGEAASGGTGGPPPPGCIQLQPFR